MMAEILKFPIVTPSQLRLSRLLSSRQTQFQFTVAEQNCHLSLSPSTQINTSNFRLTLEMDAQPISLFISNDFFSFLLPEGMDYQTALKLPETLLMASCQYSLASLLEFSSHSLGASIIFTGIDKVSPSPQIDGLALHFQFDDTSGTAQLECNQSILELLNHLPAHRNGEMPDIPIWAGLELGRSILSQPEIIGLAVGDIVFLQQHVTGQQLIIRANSRIAFVGEADGTSITVKQRMELMNEHSEAPEQPHDEQSPANEKGVDLSDVSVELLFEIGQQQLSAAELQSMQEGYIFELDRPIEQPVRIRANGKLIAECQLVQIEKRLGARITRLYE